MRTSEMGQKIRAITVKLCDGNWVPKIHLEDRENWRHVSSALHMHTVATVHACTHTQRNTC